MNIDLNDRLIDKNINVDWRMQTIDSSYPIRIINDYLESNDNLNLVLKLSSICTYDLVKSRSNIILLLKSFYKNEYPIIKIDVDKIKFENLWKFSDGAFYKIILKKLE